MPFWTGRMREFGRFPFVKGPPPVQKGDRGGISSIEPRYKKTGKMVHPGAGRPGRIRKKPKWDQ